MVWLLVGIRADGGESGRAGRSIFVFLWEWFRASATEGRADSSSINPSTP
jgi:hypothetical protein